MGTKEDFDKLMGPDFLWESVNSRLQVSPITIDYYAGMRKLDELKHLFNSSRYFLWNAYKDDEFYHKEEITDSDTIMWHRGLNWQSSVLWLNHCSDYALQAIWLTLNLHNETKNSGWYKRAIKNRELPLKVPKALKERNSKKLLPLVINYGKETRLVREWANTLKHSGIIQLEELQIFTNDGIFFQLLKCKPGCDGNPRENPDDFYILYGNEDIDVESISITNGIIELIRVCNILYQYINLIRDIFAEDKYFIIKNKDITGYSYNKNFEY